MPELPEVEIVKRGIETAVFAGHDSEVIQSLVFNRPNLRLPLPQDLPKQIKGQAFSQFYRRGKYIIALCENGHGFILHLGMSGVVKIIPRGELYESIKHDHVVFKMKNGAHLVFNDPRRFGFLKAVSEDTWQEDSAIAAMGPEPLSNDFNGPILAKALMDKRTPIKTALLDQSVVAGIGNIYACEALYMAGISPQRLATNVRGKRAERLAQAIITVLKKAIESGGSSLKDYYHADGSLGYFQHSFQVYDREGDMIDGQFPVKRIVQAGRSTFYCPAKQS
ncbi:MAG: bifunctional DNA-formamidopyrimidine glycosylase/DNA-(apurinic or apyrimidinic site) lyase [Bdellovibrionales bacterium]